MTEMFFMSYTKFNSNKTLIGVKLCSYISHIISYHIRTSRYLSPIFMDHPVHGYAHSAPVDQRKLRLQALISHDECRAVELESRGQFHTHGPLSDDLLVTR